MDNQLIQSHVASHHNLVISQYPFGHVIFTVLIGSQNYNLHGPNSDYDTVSFILPDFNTFLTSTNQNISKEYHLNDGNCVVKDLRHGINLLKKTSPNSIEYFISPYKVINPFFKEILEPIFNSQEKLFYLTHCDYPHMFKAIIGMSHQLMRLNNIGKNFAHQLRLLELYKNFLTDSPLLQWNEQNLAAARNAKFNPTDNTAYYKAEIEHIINYLKESSEEFLHSERYKEESRVNQLVGQYSANDLLHQIMITYLKLNGYKEDENYVPFSFDD